MVAVVTAAGCGGAPADRSAAVDADSAQAEAAFAQNAPVPADTSQAARASRALALLPPLRDSLRVALLPDSGTPDADVRALEQRAALETRVRQLAREFDDSVFQVALWPQGWRGYQLRRSLVAAGMPLPDSAAAEARADSLVATLRRHGVWTWRAEGDAYLALSESWLLDGIAPLLTTGTRTFLSLMAVEQETPAAEDASIQVGWDGLAERLAAMDGLIAAHPGAPFLPEAVRARGWYRGLYLRGTDNTPAFGRRTGTLDPVVRASFEDFIVRHGHLPVAAEVREYVSLLRAEGWRRTAAVTAYLRSM